LLADHPRSCGRDSGRAAEEATRRGFALVDRVSERERLAISAMNYAKVTGEGDKMAKAVDGP
jgi:hypothetical protein